MVPQGVSTGVNLHAAKYLLIGVVPGTVSAYISVYLPVMEVGFRPRPLLGVHTVHPCKRPRKLLEPIEKANSGPAYPEFTL